jgi:hypothetical protein
MPSSGILRRVALVRTDVSEELSASITRATRIGDLGTLAVTSTTNGRAEMCHYSNKQQYNSCVKSAIVTNYNTG